MQLAAAAWRTRAACRPLQPFVGPARLQQCVTGHRDAEVRVRQLQVRCAASSSSGGSGSGGAPSVCVVGAGVIGLTSALRIKQVRGLRFSCWGEAAGPTSTAVADHIRRR